MNILNKQVGTKKDGSPADHYKKMAIQPMEFCLANMSNEELSGVLKHNVMKYLWREKNDPLEDIEKAEHYISMIKHELKDRAQGIVLPKVG